MWNSARRNGMKDNCDTSGERGETMSKDTSLTIRCEGSSNQLGVVFAALQAAGWGNRDGMTEYLPLHDEGMYSWQKAILSPEEFSAILCEKQRLHETIGVILYYRNSETGIMLLAQDAQEITFGLDIGRRTIADDMTDVSWYLEHVVLPVKQAGFAVYHIEFNECV